MAKYRQSIINRAKKIVDRTPAREFIDKYYKNFDSKTKVLIRDDAEEYCNDWVESMREFINEIGVVVDVIDFDIATFVGRKKKEQQAIEDEIL